jgi:hypothetical protein
VLLHSIIDIEVLAVPRYPPALTPLLSIPASRQDTCVPRLRQELSEVVDRVSAGVESDDVAVEDILVFDPHPVAVDQVLEGFLLAAAIGEVGAGIHV